MALLRRRHVDRAPATMYDQRLDFIITHLGIPEQLMAIPKTIHRNGWRLSRDLQPVMAKLRAPEKGCNPFPPIRWRTVWIFTLQYNITKIMQIKWPMELRIPLTGTFVPTNENL